MSERALKSDSSRKIWQALLKPGEQIELAPLDAAFDWSERGFSPPMALQLAQLCHLVYVRDSLQRNDFAAGIGMTETAAFSKWELHWSRFDSSETTGNPAVLCFRGSSDPRHWLLNFSAVLVDWRHGGKVHLGFMRAYDKLKQALEQEFEVRPADSLVITGHSLGAALAQLAASDLEIPCRHVYTFGAPRPGNRGFRDVLERQCPIYRIVHGHDCVAHLPHYSKRLRKHAYVHPGHLVRVSDSGKIEIGDDADLPSLEQMWKKSLQALKDGDRITKPLPALLDHAPIGYVRVLRKCQAGCSSSDERRANSAGRGGACDDNEHR